MPSFILIHPIVWQQYTNVTDRQTDDRQMVRTGQDRTDRQRLCTTVVHSTAQNIYDDFLSCPGCGLQPFCYDSADCPAKLLAGQ